MSLPFAFVSSIVEDVRSAGASRILEASMGDLIREERYLFFVGTKEHVLRVQELVWGSTTWPERFRICLPAAYTRDSKKFYGTTAREAVERAIEYLSSPVCEARLSPSPMRERLN
jgi:hypothetical protein